MLVGQDIGFTEVVWISLFGMAVATVAIILLMIFVIIMSKIISHGKNVALAKKSTSGKLVPPSTGVTEDEIASITAALCMERPEQFRIVSITGR